MDNILGSSRRSVLVAGMAVSASWLVGRSQAQIPESVMTRPIPHSGEQLPIVGLGTAVSFPSANESQRAGLKDVIDALVAGGGKLIDTASVYGNAESVIGDIVRASNARNKIFIATKIEVRSAKAGADDRCSVFGPKRSICCSSTTSRVPARAYRSCESGKPPTVVATSALPARTVRTITRWKRSSGGRSRILSRSIIRWTIAPQRSASFQRQRMREPRC
jgi:hypothetical protein